jgi:AcrR family transcriptional regulator
MSSPSRTRERIAQKLRTRRALLTAAGDLVAAGQTPTVAEAADAAMVSRATAYRYFPSQEALLVEVPLQIGIPTVKSLFDGDGAPTEVEDRVALVHNTMYDHIRDREVQFRLFHRNALLHSLDADRADVPPRPAFRLELLDAALEPLEPELHADELERLKTALSILVGTEAMFAMRDVLRLDHEQARERGEWAVRQMVRAARHPDLRHPPTEIIARLHSPPDAPGRHETAPTPHPAGSANAGLDR